jgi:hypothetical protein
MFDALQNTDAHVPFRFFMADGSNYVGLVAGSVTAASIIKGDGTIANITVTPSNWYEATAGGFANMGVYALTVPAAVLDVLGNACVSIKVATAANGGAVAFFKVVSATAEEVKVDTAAIDTKVDVSVSTRAPAATAVSNADLTSVRAAKLDNLDVGVSTRPSLLDIEGSTVLAKEATVARNLDISEGRWKIDKTAKQMIFYKVDGITEVRRYNLFNDIGAPDAEVVFDRVPVP